MELQVARDCWSCLRNDKEEIGLKTYQNIIKLNWQEVLKLANRFGDITSKNYGAIPSLPTIKHLNK